MKGVFWPVPDKKLTKFGQVVPKELRPKSDLRVFSLQGFPAAYANDPVSAADHLLGCPAG
jgi:hypothetical protein